MANIFSVSQFCTLVNEYLGHVDVVVEGEVASIQVRQGRWVFFDLKDETASINCFLPASLGLHHGLEDGAKIRVSGKPGIYAKYGKFSFSVRAVELLGAGALRKAFEETKRLLEAEGLFAPEHKQPLPAFPQHIAVITSAQGRAYTDFMRILEDRWGAITVQLLDVRVQGQEAEADIVGALRYVNERADADVIVLTRGGGGAEELQAFNQERLVREIFASRIPVISAIGHEEDVVLSDLVADVRAATPTHAAKLVVPDRAEVATRIQTLEQRVVQAAQHMLAAQDARVGQTVLRLEHAVGNVVRSVADRAEVLVARMDRLVADTMHATNMRVSKLTDYMQHRNPRAVLARGYAIVSVDGKTISRATDVAEHAIVKVQLAHGSIDADVQKIHP